MEKLLLKKWMLLLALIFCFGANVLAQSIKIIGQVIDKNQEPIPGVNIMIEGTSYGTVSDVDGNFTLIVPSSGVTLVIAHQSYKTKRIEIKAQQEVKLEIMLEDIDELSFTNSQRKLFYERMIPLKDDMGYYELWA